MAPSTAPGDGLARLVVQPVEELVVLACHEDSGSGGKKGAPEWLQHALVSKELVCVSRTTEPDRRLSVVIRAPFLEKVRMPPEVKVTRDWAALCLDKKAFGAETGPGGLTAISQTLRECGVAPSVVSAPLSAQLLLPTVQLPVAAAALAEAGHVVGPSERARIAPLVAQTLASAPELPPPRPPPGPPPGLEQRSCDEEERKRQKAAKEAFEPKEKEKEKKKHKKTTRDSSDASKAREDDAGKKRRKNTSDDEDSHDEKEKTKDKKRKDKSKAKETNRRSTSRSIGKDAKRKKDKDKERDKSRSRSHGRTDKEKTKDKGKSKKKDKREKDRDKDKGHSRSQSREKKESKLSKATTPEDTPPLDGQVPNIGSEPLAGAGPIENGIGVAATAGAYATSSARGGKITIKLGSQDPASTTMMLRNSEAHQNISAVAQAMLHRVSAEMPRKPEPLPRPLSELLRAPSVAGYAQQTSANAKESDEEMDMSDDATENPTPAVASTVPEAPVPAPQPQLTEEERARLKKQEKDDSDRREAAIAHARAAALATCAKAKKKDAAAQQAPQMIIMPPTVDASGAQQPVMMHVVPHGMPMFLMQPPPPGGPPPAQVVMQQMMMQPPPPPPPGAPPPHIVQQFQSQAALATGGLPGLVAGGQPPMLPQLPALTDATASSVANASSTSPSGAESTRPSVAIGDRADAGGGCPVGSTVKAPMGIPLDSATAPSQAIVAPVPGAPSTQPGAPHLGIAQLGSMQPGASPPAALLQLQQMQQHGALPPAALLQMQQMQQIAGMQMVGVPPGMCIPGIQAAGGPLGVPGVQINDGLLSGLTPSGLHASPVASSPVPPPPPL